MEGLVSLFIYLLIVGVIFYVLYWALKTIALPEPFNKIALVILVVLTVLVLLNLLLGIVGGVPRLVLH